VGGSGKRNKRKVGAGYETGTCFVAQDVSEKYQSQIHRPQGTFRADSRCTVMHVLQSRTHASQIFNQCYPHSLNTFHVSVYQKYTVAHCKKQTSVITSHYIGVLRVKGCDVIHSSII